MTSMLAPVIKDWTGPMLFVERHDMVLKQICTFTVPWSDEVDLSFLKRRGEILFICETEDGVFVVLLTE